MESSAYPSLWPFLVYGVAVLLLVSAMLIISHFIGERHSEPQTGQVFESGIRATGTARLRFPVHFYLVAMFFVIFDLESVFIISWVIAIKSLGWAGYIAILIFIGILVAVLVYEWRIGALDFGPSGKKILKAYHHQNGQSKPHEMVDNKSIRSDNRS